MGYVKTLRQIVRRSRSENARWELVRRGGVDTGGSTPSTTPLGTSAPHWGCARVGCATSCGHLYFFTETAIDLTRNALDALVSFAMKFHQTTVFFTAYLSPCAHTSGSKMWLNYLGTTNTPHSIIYNPSSKPPYTLISLTRKSAYTSLASYSQTHRTPCPQTPLESDPSPPPAPSTLPP